MRKTVLLIAGLLIITPALGIVPPASAQTPRPAGCDPVSLNQFYGYQYDANTRRAWDSYSAQYANVCVKNTPGPPQGCGQIVERPWYTASGQPTTGPLCWYQERPVPVRSATQPPAGCFPTALTARGAYTGDANVRALWDRYSSETLGVCESIGQYPDDCRYRVQEFANKWLCWWPAGLDASALHAIVDRRGLESVANSFLAVQAICDFIGTGRVAFEFRIGDQTVQMLVENCRVTDIQFLTPPDGCVAVNPYAYTIIPRATIDAAMANAKGACRMMRAPAPGECNEVVQLTAQAILCFWGKPGSKQANAFFTDTPRFTVTTSIDAFRAILNAADRGETAKRLVAGGYIAVNARSMGDQVQLRLAFQQLDNLVPVDPLTSGNIRFEFRPGQPAQVVDNSAGGFFAVTPQGIFVLNEHGSAMGARSPSVDRFGPRLDITNTATWDAGLTTSDDVVPFGPITNSDFSRGLLSALEFDIERVATVPQAPGGNIGPFMLQSLDPQGNVPPGRNPFVHGNLQPDGTYQWFGPGVPDDPETIMDDFDHCPVICSLRPGSDAFTTPRGSAYLQGAALAHLSTNALVSNGLGVV